MKGALLAERFRIGDRLGAGAMGEVWSALDERMRREVAVKLVHAQFGMGEDETQSRFRREVQLAGRLSHRNIVTVHDWGEVPVGGRQTLYLVMELVPGVSLRQSLKEAGPPWPLAVGWAVQIADALHAAHRRGVIHRDIKPANVLLTPEGTVKVLDFGVAKFMGDTMSVHELTVTGALLGSPPYMSPEQAHGVREIDHRSDLYSLGCLLYHAVTGRPPFTSRVALAVLRMQMEDTPTPPADLVAGVPAALNDLILRLLAKRPEDRPADAAAVHDALSTLLVDEAVSMPGADILGIAQLGRADSVTGRLLNKSWQLWQGTLRQTTDRREEAEAVAESARAQAESARAQALEELRRSRSEAERLLVAASAQAQEVTEHTEQIRRRAEQRLEEASWNAEATLERARIEAGRIRAEAEGLLAGAKDEAARIRAAFGKDRAAPPRPVASDTVSPFGFELVRRGYDRGQVDDRVSKLVADRDSALQRILALERRIEELYPPQQQM
ncbi:protein kinase [Streptomyces sp. BE147]|uniref:serine/threonine-protein kinase n=1 Tax=unclassified Streptomyces TaxID=2593676 RepID=UPI002E75DC12|nr:protein kinase [Streptomyces sp. BE147]MEE1739823.1 protein kinase [Streptomyces sp. BE147]